MSRLGWTCPTCDKTYLVPDLVCETCGTIAGQLRWILSLVERMCNASRFFGRPEPGRYPGPTPQQAAMSSGCPDCDGTGAEAPVLLSAWVSCTRCKGMGYLWRHQLTPAERAADDVRKARRAAELRQAQARQGRDGQLDTAMSARKPH
jgi:hypothetical protein